MERLASISSVARWGCRNTDSVTVFVPLSIVMSLAQLFYGQRARGREEGSAGVRDGAVTERGKEGGGEGGGRHLGRGWVWNTLSCGHTCDLYAERPPRVSLWSDHGHLSPPSQSRPGPSGWPLAGAQQTQSGAHPHLPSS